MATCKLCQEPLVVELEPEDEDMTSETQTVPDDLQLPCGCHFHWQCLLDESPSISRSLSCPSCTSYLATHTPGPSTTTTSATPQSQARIPATYTNEGGTQTDLDLLPLIVEEAYLSANPAARPARAMHLMCAEGDAAGVAELWLRVTDESSPASEGEPAMTLPRLLRYRDPLAGLQSALHVAVTAGQEDVAWLLLWAGSRLDRAAFPPGAAEAAASLGLGTRPVAREGEEDIRALRDGAGRTAGDLAAAAGGVWVGMVERGVFEP